MEEPDTSEDSAHGQADRLQSLSQIGRAITSTLDLGALYDTMYGQIGQLMDTTQFFIALASPDEGPIDVPYLREAGQLLVNQQLPQESVTNLVIERGAPLRFNTDAEYRVFVSQNGLPNLTLGRAESEGKVWVPLSTGNRTIGAISVQSNRRHAYSDDDVRTLSVVASQAAVAIQNARLYEESQSNVKQTQALLSIARTINSSLELPTVLDAILMGMREVVPYYFAAILLPDDAHRWLDVVGVVGPLGEERRREIKIPFGQGITGRVFESGETLNVGNVYRFEGYIPHGIGEVHAEMAVPLKRGDTVVGVLDLERAEINSFTHRDEDVLTIFASQAAVAIENARLYADQQQRVSDLQTIQSIVQSLTPLHEMQSIATVVGRELKRLIEFHTCRIFALDAEQDLLVPLVQSDAEHGELRLRVGEGVAGWAVAEGISVLVPDSLKDARVVQIPGTPFREESMIAVPLIYGERVQGVIFLSRLGANQFDTNSLRLLEIIGAQTAIAFDRARLYEELRTEAITDPLTRLYNRRYLLDRLREERSRAIRNRQALTAMMLDIDRFKQVNDSHGHDAGDVVLQELASLIRGVVRAEDLVARYGGEEFCVLLPEISGADAESVAQRLRGMVAAHSLPDSAGSERITVSIGMAGLLAGDEGHELFTRADLAMYRVKRLGGNRVCIDDGNGSYRCLDPA